jgi:hypothetical protein
MAETRKVLGQAAPNATTETDLYAPAAATQAVVSSIVVANRSTAATFRISVSVDNAATANKDYIAYDAPIAANEVLSFTLGITLGDTDKIRVYASTGNLSFSAFGVELT